MEKNYWIVRMGQGNEFAKVSYENDFIGVGWNVGKNLTDFQTLSRKEFANRIGPAVEEAYKDKSANARASVIGNLFRFSNLMKTGDVVLVPHTQDGKFYVGVIDSDYFYLPEQDNVCRYQHRRNVIWKNAVSLSDASEDLRKILGSRLTITNASKYSEEIEKPLSGKETEEAVESYEEFGLESHLEDFLVENWSNLDLGKKYSILKEDNEVIGQQYVTPIGRIDILAQSKDGTEWLVIELKKGKSADRVVGQVLRYIGWVQENEAKENQKVRGLIITKEKDDKLLYALKTLDHVDVMAYAVKFELRGEK